MLLLERVLQILATSLCYSFTLQNLKLTKLARDEFHASSPYRDYRITKPGTTSQTWLIHFLKIEIWKSRMAIVLIWEWNISHDQKKKKKVNRKCHACSSVIRLRGEPPPIEA